MDTEAKRESRQKVETFLNRISKNPILLVIATALLSSSGKNIVPSFRFLLALLASHIHDSSEAQQAGLFLLVNFIIFAIFVRSKPLQGALIPQNYSQAIEAAPTPTRRYGRHRSRRECFSLDSYPDFTNDVLEPKTERALGEAQPLNTTKTAPSRSTSMGKRSASYPVLYPDTDAQDEASTSGSKPTSPQKKQEHVAVYKDELTERIEAFLARNRNQWERQRQESLERKRRLQHHQGWR